ncbi:MAG: hypothetical protein E7288_03205 [Lachnospiraceae bacterium]|nr:hypothetical protein [Lachnospiraceae bacterium]
MKKSKRIISLLLMTMLVAGAVMMNGCKLQPPPPRIDNAQAALEAKYGEKFNVRIDESYSSVFYATCSPVNNPEVLFEARFSDSTGTTNIDQDDYYERYTASLINEILEKDLQKFFPGAYFRTDAHIVNEMNGRFTDIRNRTLEEMLENKPEGQTGSMDLDIYVDRSIGTTQQYEEEYRYFTETVAKYTQENKMLPVSLSIIMVDTTDMGYIEEYFKENASRGNDFFDKLKFGPDKPFLNAPEDTNPGETPRMSAVFLSRGNVIGNEEEYIRRREIWEDAK